jgi:hypothetical protein
MNTLTARVDGPPLGATAPARSATAEVYDDTVVRWFALARLSQFPGDNL